jgi:hypothetical protein
MALAGLARAQKAKRPVFFWKRRARWAIVSVRIPASLAASGGPMQPAKSAKTITPALEYARILSGGPDGHDIETSFGTLRARRAASCLLSPEPGDMILASLDMSGAAWILAVLERAGETPSRLSVAGDAVFEAEGGSLTLSSGRDMTLACEGALTSASREISVHAERADAAIGVASLLARAVKTQAKRVRTVARHIETTCRELTERLVRGSRIVQDHHEEQAASKRILVEETLSLHAKNHTILAEEEVVVNAERINMG